MGAPSALGAHHPEVARLRRLLRHRADRTAERAFVLEGPTALAEAIDAGAAIEAIYVAAGTVVPEVPDGVTVRQLDPALFQRVASTVTPQPVLAVARAIDVPLDVLRAATFVLVAVDLQDPGNAGTIIRSAVAAGADGVVMAGSTVDVHNPKTVRATAGALFRVPVAVVTDAAAAVAALRTWGLHACAAVATGGVPMHQVDLTSRTALVVGNESHGLPVEVTAACDSTVSIPMAGPVESLNAAMAATVLAFELSRQRREDPA